MREKREREKDMKNETGVREKDRKRGMVVERKIGRETGVEERGVERELQRGRRRDRGETKIKGET